VGAEGEVEARVTTAVRQRLEREPRGQHVRPTAAVRLGDGQAGEPELGHLRPDVGIPATLAVAVDDARLDVLACELTHALDEGLLFLAQTGVHAAPAPGG